jgi:hypothetical protein
MRSSRCWPALALLGLLGCSSPQSFIVLLLESTTPIAGVARIGVVVSQGAAEMKTLTYPAGNLTIVADGSINMGTLSVGFAGDQTGDITFVVTAFDARGCAIGGGPGGTASIIKGATNELTIHLRAEVSCTGDASAPDLQPDSGFPGCDPGGLSCPTGQSCQVDCQDRANVCAVAGSSGPGGSCAGDAGCAPGTQCFDYTSLGCKGTQICLQFCAGDTECAAQGQGGLGPGSFCRDPVACDRVATAYHTCTLRCDPTAAAAAAASTGCPAGLACGIPSSMDHVDCTCPESTRTGLENASCTGTAQCAPGFLCEQTCRAICRCDAKSGICTAANDCPTSRTTCTPVPNQTIYGVCL